MNDTTTVVVRPNSTTIVANSTGGVLLGSNTVIVSTGAMGPVGPQGPAGPAGPGGGSANFELNQVAAANPWVIPHNFGWKPNIQVLDTSGEEMIGYTRTDSLDMNTTTLTWELLISGKALAS